MTFEILITRIRNMLDYGLDKDAIVITLADCPQDLVFFAYTAVTML